MFKILSIDGGGIRGVFPAYILKLVQERLDVDVFEHIDMFAGTSTGSIITTGIACKKQPSEIAELYKEKGSEIFRNTISSWWPKKLKQGIHSKYGNRNLTTILDSVFEGIKLGDITKPLLIPSTDIGNGGVHVFKSNYSINFTRDKNVPVSKAVLASCSAPVFFNPVKIGNYTLSDGGIWANNPALAAVIDAHYRLNIDLQDIKILSLGTGHSKTAYGTEIEKNWGLLTGWKNIEFINFLLSLQAQSTHNYLQLMIGNEKLLRINFESDNPLPMDEMKIIDDLITRADREFTYRSDDLIEFFKN